MPAGRGGAGPVFDLVVKSADEARTQAVTQLLKCRRSAQRNGQNDDRDDETGQGNDQHQGGNDLARRRAHPAKNKWRSADRAAARRAEVAARRRPQPRRGAEAVRP